MTNREAQLGEVKMRLPTHRTTRCLATLAAVCGSGLLLTHATPVRAYSGSEHIRFPDQAYQVMNVVRRGGFYADEAKRLNSAGTFAPLSVRPPSIPASQDAAWQTFIAQVMAAPAKLDNVLVGLANPTRSSADCGGVFASLPAGTALQTCRASDLAFAPRRDWAANNNECYLRQGYKFGSAGNDAFKLTPFYQGLQTNYTGALLGMWATKPDDETGDTSVFVRPTNLAFIGELKNLGEQAVEIGLTAVLAPVFCFADFFFTGDPGACFDDAVSASHDIDPVARIDDSILLPIEEWTAALTGPVGEWLLAGKSNPASMWHFAVPSASGMFNIIPGIDLAESRLGNSTDSVDQAITAYFDLLGITMNPSNSTGPSRYGQFADGPLNRHDSDWASFSIAHVEFDPVDNLARYGWQQFVQNGGARGLGWVLHAIGDTFCPQHTIGSLGWGHQPWERFANVRWVDQQVFLEDDVVQHYPNMVSELTYAFGYWNASNQGSQTDWVGRMVEQLAIETAGSSFAVKDRAFKGTISVEWGAGIADSDSDATDAYDSERPALKNLMMRSVGASIAFLTKASLSAPTSTASPCACTGTGFARSAEDRNGTEIFAPAGGCVKCGMGVFVDEPNLADGRCVAACPPDKPTAVGGVCTSAQACPPATPFRLNGACVTSCCNFDSTCPSTTPIRQNGSCVALDQCTSRFVVDNRVCATGCPAGQSPNAAGFCSTPPITPNQQCSGTAQDGDKVCCVPRAGICTTGTDCCSKDCRDDGICRGLKGDSCVVGNDCVSQGCKNNVCTGNPGDTCLSDNECTFICQLGNTCCGVPNSGCSSDSDCCTGYSCGDGFCFANL